MRSCPSPEILLETISIPGEMSRWSFFKAKFHTFRCPPCQEKLTRLKATWDAYFQPEPEVASSLVRVYSRLQKDETLILKGWKLGNFQGSRPSGTRMFLRSWGFPTGIAVSLGLFTIVMSPTLLRQKQDAETLASAVSPAVPLSPIRTRDRNSVKVRYVQPELLSSMEFETVSRP